MTATVILVPMLGRPHRVEPLLESLARFTPEDHRVVFCVTENDHDVMALTADFARLVFPPRPYGDYAAKINAGIQATSEPFIFTGADDLRFHPGWLSAALARFADPAVGVVGTQDLCNARTINGTHATHFLVRRAYVDEWGTIDEPAKLFHEGYWHECIDDELVATAKHRGVWAFADDSIVEHLHPMVGKADWDPMYQYQRHRIHQGRKLFRLREHMWST